MTIEKPNLIDVTGRILTIRGHRALLDSDLATVYGVNTLRLNEQVRRNSSRFPDDFLLRLTTEEFAALRSQFSILKLGRGQHRKYPPLAFAEHGAVMASNAKLKRKLDVLEKSVVMLGDDSKR